MDTIEYLESPGSVEGTDAEAAGWDPYVVWLMHIRRDEDYPAAFAAGADPARPNPSPF